MELSLGLEVPRQFSRGREHRRHGARDIFSRENIRVAPQPQTVHPGDLRPKRRKLPRLVLCHIIEEQEIPVCFCGYTVLRFT